MLFFPTAMRYPRRHFCGGKPRNGRLQKIRNGVNWRLQIQTGTSSFPFTSREAGNWNLDFQGSYTAAYLQRGQATGILKTTLTVSTTPTRQRIALAPCKMPGAHFLLFESQNSLKKIDNSPMPRPKILHRLDSLYSGRHSRVCQIRTGN